MSTVISPVPVMRFPKGPRLLRTVGFGREAISSFPLGDGIELNDALGNEMLEELPQDGDSLVLHALRQTFDLHLRSVGLHVLGGCILHWLAYPVRNFLTTILLVVAVFSIVRL